LEIVVDAPPDLAVERVVVPELEAFVRSRGSNWMA
jgi:hypothetical protein